jgi:hypothetical protein
MDFGKEGFWEGRGAELFVSQLFRRGWGVGKEGRELGGKDKGKNTLRKGSGVTKKEARIIIK